MDVSHFVQTIAIYALPVLFAITLHEAAHGYVARHFGDMTAFAQGRISLNPARHIDLVGTILVPIAILAASTLAGGAGLLFGWAKPVPVNYSALRRPRQNMVWVAAAGPGANLAMAIGWALLLKIFMFFPDNSFSVPMRLMCEAGMQVNVVLMLLNLLPSRIAWGYAKLEPLGFPILLVLLFTSVLGVILAPMVNFSFRVLGTVFRI